MRFIVQGDHPILRRQDKPCKTRYAANAHAEQLERMGYENIVIKVIKRPQVNNNV